MTTEFNSGEGATAVQEAPSSQPTETNTASQQGAPTSSPAGSGAEGGTRTPAPAPSGPVFGDADLPNDQPPPRARDEAGRFTSSQSQQGQAQQAEQPGQPSQAATWLTGELKNEAAFYGFSEAEAKSFGNPELLQAAMAAMDRRLVRDYGLQQSDGRQQFAGSEFPAQGGVGMQPWQQQQQGWNNPPVQQQPGQQRQLPPGQGQYQQQAAQPGQFDLSKYKDLFDEDTTRVLGELHGSFQGELARQQAVIEQLNNTLAAFQEEAAFQQGQRFESEMDTLFDGISKDYSDLFGKGPIRELSPDLQKSRQELVAYMEHLKQVDRQIGRSPPADKVNFGRALRAMYGERQAKAIRNQISEEVASRRSQGVNRPTARTAAPLDPLEAAARRADELYRSRGFDVPTGSGAATEI